MKRLAALATVLAFLFVMLGTAEERRSSWWAKARAVHLIRCPTCAACGGAEYRQVHHIKPYHLFPELELDDGTDGTDGNLITLCEKPGRNCHFIFGHLYDFRGPGNPHVRDDAARMLSRVKARKHEK